MAGCLAVFILKPQATVIRTASETNRLRVAEASWVFRFNDLREIGRLIGLLISFWNLFGIGATSKDLVAILQSLKSSGALHAELEII